MSIFSIFKRKSTPSAAAIKKAIGAARARLLVAQYDSLRWRNDPQRRIPVIRTEATETEQNFSADRRILAYTQCDDLCDNTVVGSCLDTVSRLTIGDRLSPVFTGDDGETWQDIWDDWARHCGHEEDEDWHTMLGVVLRAVLKHGDCVCLLDDELTDGKLRVWDADQICNITDFDAWKAERNAPRDWRQVEGVVVSGSGRVQGYFVTHLRNRYAVGSEDATYLPRGTALKLSLKHKITEYRGEPFAILRQEQVSQDSKDLLRAEIAAGRLAAELALVVEQPQGADASGIGGILAGYEGHTDELTQGTDITDEDIAALTHVARDSKTFEAFGDRAAVVNVPNGTKVTSLTPQRPSNQVMAWQGMLDTSIGKSLGIMSCLSNGRADNSYSSGEIELNISWSAFATYAECLSKLVDYCAERICPHQKYEISYTEPISIDSEKEEKVETLRLQSGRSTLREQLGPRYKQKLEQLSYEKKLLEELDLTTLAPFWQTSSGAPIQEPTTGETSPATEQEEE